MTTILILFALVFAVFASGGVSVGPATAQASWECAPPTPPAAATPAPATVAFPGGGGSLTIFAAASLTDAFTKIKSDLEQQHPGLSITYNFADSPTLVTQLSEGAAVKGGQTELAQAFISYLLGSDGQATMHSFGFAPPS